MLPNAVRLRIRKEPTTVIQKLNPDIGSKLEDWYRYVDSSRPDGGLAAPKMPNSSGKAARGRRRFRFIPGSIEQLSGEKAAPAPKETREELLARLLDPVLTLDEAAQVLNVCSTTVRRYTNRGLLEHHRTIGNQRRFRLSHVLALLARMSDGNSSVTGAITGAGTLSGNTSALLAEFNAAKRIEALDAPSAAARNS